ncbi:MAG TPA: alpha/beta hydrolase [Solirubrobacteraceae bacterium]|nr:alpha/beta hydrolase [Solirubrobacteraceae bacterium]
MYEGFEHRDVMTDRGSVHAVTAGSGPPLLLLHGFPETHLMWHATAPPLAERFSVVACDLPGYGDSEYPDPADDHLPHSKRALARDLIQVMAALGHERFAVAGHDRGGRVGYRMALDSPEVVTRLAVLDIVPTLEVWERANDRFALLYWHWGMLARPEPQAEVMLLAAPPETFFSHHFAQVRAGHPGYPIEIVDDYLDRIENPAGVHAMCEDYRAGATVDREHDAADRAAGRRIECPLLVLWGAHGALPHFHDDVLAVWEGWVRDRPLLSGRALDAGHFIAEDQPIGTASALSDFFA